MTPLVTIMIMYVGQGGTYMTQFDNQMECSRALYVFSTLADDLAQQYDGDVWASCVRTFAPSVSIRPQARGVRV